MKIVGGRKRGALISSITTNLKKTLSYVPLLGRYFAVDKSKKKFEARNLKDIHQKESSWNRSLFNKVRELGSKVYGNIFQSSLFKLFVTDESIPGFDPKFLGSLECKRIHIREENKATTLSDKYLISSSLAAYNKVQKPVVAAFHGARTTGRNMGKLVSRLVKSRGYKVLAGDLVGFGANKDKKLTEQRLIMDISQSLKVANKESKGHGVIPIAHSAGTALTVSALLKLFEEEDQTGDFKIKVEDFILVSPWDSVSNLISDFQSNEKNWDKVKDAFGSEDKMSDFIEQNQDKAETIAKSVFGSHWETMENLYKLLELNMNRPEEYRIKNLNVIHGKEDPFVSFHRAKALVDMILALSQSGNHILPNTRFCLVRDGNHFDMQANKDQTYFPISNIIQLLREKPEGIESGEASFRKEDYRKNIALAA